MIKLTEFISAQQLNLSAVVEQNHIGVDVAEYLQKGFTHGDRNNQALKVASVLAHKGVDSDNIRLMLQAINLKSPEPLPQREIDGVVRQSIKYAKQDGIIDEEGFDADYWGDEVVKKTTELAEVKAKRKEERAKTKAARVASGEFTDLGNMKLLIDAHGADISYVAENEQWLIWDNCRWAKDNNSVIELAKTLSQLIILRAKDADALKWAKASEGVGKIKAAVELAKTDPRVLHGINDFDNNDEMLNCLDGCINLRTREVSQPDRKQLCSKVANVKIELLGDLTNLEGISWADYCPTWNRFLQQIFLNNFDLISWVQKAVGYSMTGMTNEQCLFVAWGKGANGKSTFINVLRMLLADYATTIRSNSLTQDANESSSNDLAALKGARFVAASETEEYARLRTSRIKEVTGGEEITARFLFGEFFSYKPKFKLWLSTNHKPKADADDAALWRRMRLVPFNYTCPVDQQDKDLGSKLLAELDGIALWAIVGAFNWYNQGLGECAVIAAATTEYREENDVWGKFEAEKCAVGDHEQVKLGALREAFNAFSGRIMAPVKFGKYLEDKGYTIRAGSGNIRYALGIGLAETSAYDEDAPDESGYKWDYKPN